MGTRGVFGVHIDGKSKLAYAQFDSYHLVGQVRQMLKEHDMTWLKSQAKALLAVDEKVLPTPQQVKKLAPYTDLGVSNQSTKDWYCLFRKAQGSIQDLLSIGMYLPSETFVKESLFCEWGYVLNLDAGTFEVYKGFQCKPHKKGLFADQWDKKKKWKPEYKGQDRYYPIALVISFPLADIPEDWLDRLQAELRQQYPKDYED